MNSPAEYDLEIEYRRCYDEMIAWSDQLEKVRSTLRDVWFGLPKQLAELYRRMKEEQDQTLGNEDDRATIAAWRSLVNDALALHKAATAQYDTAKAAYEEARRLNNAAYMQRLEREKTEAVARDAQEKTDTAIVAAVRRHALDSLAAGPTDVATLATKVETVDRTAHNAWVLGMTAVGAIWDDHQITLHEDDRGYIQEVDVALDPKRVAQKAIARRTAARKRDAAAWKARQLASSTSSNQGDAL